MSESPPHNDTPAAQPLAAPRANALAPAFRALALVLAGAAAFDLAPAGWGWCVVPGVGLVLATATALRGLREQETSASPVEMAPAKAALVLPRQVVPVWNRSLALVRDHSERDANQLLESFAKVASTLDQALAGANDHTSLELSAADTLIARHAPEIERLLSTTRQAIQLKDDLLAGVQTMVHELDQMVALTREIQSVARSTHLLALNASVEATRGVDGGAGFKVVAAQVRDLAAQSRHVGQQLTRHVAAMQEAARTLKDKARHENTDPDEIALQAQENARGVLLAMVGSLSDFTRSSRVLRDTSREVQDELERILMGLQGQDRLSQMLGAVSADMERMSAWFEEGTDPAGTAPARWLERLESSYTMEEQRSSHHDMKAIELDAPVEFF